MRQSKTSKKTKVKVSDLRPKKNAKGGGRAQLRDINVVKYSDKASPKLML